MQPTRSVGPSTIYANTRKNSCRRWSRKLEGLEDILIALSALHLCPSSPVRLRISACSHWNHIFFSPQESSPHI